MAAVSLAKWFGNLLRAPSATDIANATKLENSISAQIKGQNLEFPVAPMAITLPVAASISASSDGYSVTWPVPFPCHLLAADLGALGAAGATGTMDVEYYDGSSWTSVFSAAKDVKTGIGASARYAPNADTDADTLSLDYGYLVRVKGSSGSGGALTGAVGILWIRQK